MNREIRRSGGLSFLIFPIFLFLISGCERGCARSWFEKHGVGDQAPARGPMGPPSAIDCPDGLARCTGGVVEVSRLATIALPCKGAPETCVCPWDRAGDCEQGCVADDVEVVVDREMAARQLCVGPSEGGAVVRQGSGVGGCDEDVLYRCTGGAVIACLDHAVAGVCERGCFHEGTDIGAELPVTREAAFAILCSR